MEERGVSLPVVNIGCHLSFRRDPSRTVQWAADNGFGCMQIFASSPGACTMTAPETAVALI